MMTEAEVRKVIAEFKTFAEGFMTKTNTDLDTVDSNAMAKAWFIAEPSFHDNWDGLNEEIQGMWEWYANAALIELKTGNPIPSE